MTSQEKLSTKSVLDALSKVEEPGFQKDITSLGWVRSVQIDDGNVTVQVELPTPASPYKDLIRERAQEEIGKLAGVAAVTLELSAEVKGPMRDPAGVLPNAKHIIAVASGKGGVGKSTTAVNLALALKAFGASVGLFDVDVYGPSIPMMLGVSGQPKITGPSTMLPLKAHGIKVMSMGFLTGADVPAILRGPMVHGIIKQLLEQVDWGALDYMVIDLPPGTGDAHLTLSQEAPLSGAVIVTTPQDVSLIDARKGIRMFESVKVPILGIVENMSYFVCDDCGKRHDIFRSGGGKRTAEDFDLPLLGRIPIDPEVTLSGDEGVPIIAKNPSSKVAEAYRSFACQVAEELAVRHYRATPTTDKLDIPPGTVFEV